MAEETTARDRLRREMTHNHLYMDDERADELINAYARELAEEIRERARLLRGDPAIAALHGEGYIDGIEEGADTIDHPLPES